MAKDPGGFFDLSPCFWFCCIRRRPRHDSRASSRSRSFSYSESSGSDSDSPEYDDKTVNDQIGHGVNEDDKIAAVKAGYGATDHDKVTKKLNGYEVAVVEPMQSQDEAANYSVTSPDFTYSDEEEGEAITKPLKSLTTVSEQISDEDMLDNRSDLSSSPSLGEIRVIGDPTRYSLTNVSASREQLLTKVGDTSSVDSWPIDRPSSLVDGVSPRSQLQHADTASVKSWVSRTSKSPSVMSMQAETASLKSWVKEETASLDRQLMKRSTSNTESLVLSTSASLDNITEVPSAAEAVEEPYKETSVVEELSHNIPVIEQPVNSPVLERAPSNPPAEVQVQAFSNPSSTTTPLVDPPSSIKESCDPPKSTETNKPAENVYTVQKKNPPNQNPVGLAPVPSIEIDSVSENLQPKESIKSKNSDDSGVVVDKFNSKYKSQSAVFSDDADAVSLRSATSTTSLDAAGLPKKKKKLKLFKKLKFKKKKKKNTLLAQHEAGYSVSTPALGLNEDAMSSNLSSSSKSRYSASLLLASLDDLSDDDICRE